MDLFRSNIYDITQYVENNTDTRDQYTVSCGIPHGSVLDPLSMICRTVWTLPK